MTTSSATTLAADAFVTFVQRRLPGLTDGEYRLTISQHIEDSDGKPIADAPISREYTFAVTGDRFGLADPAGTIYATFPQQAHSGEYATVLPHIVLTVPTLPWARSPAGAQALPPGGLDAEGDVPSWLAVLTLGSDDFSDGASMPGSMATVGDLFPPAIAPTSTLGTAISYFASARDTSGLEPGQSLDAPISIIDLPMTLFQAIAPTLADLSMVAHVRQVTLVNKPTMAGISDVGVPTAEFSVIVGNRLPADGVSSTAYLVSLEGLAAYLPVDPPQPVATAAAGTTIRLAVLASWSFTSTGSTATFVDGLLALDGGAAAAQDADVCTPVLPSRGTDDDVARALRLGFVPLDHDLRDAGATVSWYRGPLAPTPVPAGRVTVPVASADQAMILDPETGLLDVSYAAAWSLGRLMALQSKAFSTSLYGWKRGVTRSVVDSLERALLAPAAPDAPAPAAATATPAAAAPAGADAAARPGLAKVRLSAGTGQRLADPAPARPAAPTLSAPAPRAAADRASLLGGGLHRATLLSLAARGAG